MRPAAATRAQRMEAPTPRPCSATSPSSPSPESCSAARNASAPGTCRNGWRGTAGSVAKATRRSCTDFSTKASSALRSSSFCVRSSPTRDADNACSSWARVLGRASEATFEVAASNSANASAIPARNRGSSRSTKPAPSSSRRGAMQRSSKARSAASAACCKCRWTMRVMTPAGSTNPKRAIWSANVCNTSQSCTPFRGIPSARIGTEPSKNSCRNRCTASLYSSSSDVCGRVRRQRCGKALRIKSRVSFRLGCPSLSAKTCDSKYASFSARKRHAMTNIHNFVS
mmetsp:Transcript_28579/g.72281  ORF Transcript_28579/g.72281 Transcript_28579/m.72281 type:complete len:285 (-) Transcript_28579:875-1729(-)